MFLGGVGAIVELLYGRLTHRSVVGWLVGGWVVMCWWLVVGWQAGLLVDWWWVSAWWWGGGLARQLVGLQVAPLWAGWLVGYPPLFSPLCFFLSSRFSPFSLLSSRSPSLFSFFSLFPFLSSVFSLFVSPSLYSLFSLLCSRFSLLSLL